MGAGALAVVDSRRGVETLGGEFGGDEGED